MFELAVGDILRWRDRDPQDERLGIVIDPVSDTTVYVLMSDLRADVSVEAFVARPEATGNNASELTLGAMEHVSDGDPSLIEFLRQLGRSWWEIAAHQGGEHDATSVPNCPLCSEEPAM